MEAEIFGIYCFCINCTDQKTGTDSSENPVARCGLCSKPELFHAIPKIVFPPMY